MELFLLLRCLNNILRIDRNASSIKLCANGEQTCRDNLRTSRGSAKIAANITVNRPVISRAIGVRLASAAYLEKLR